MPVLEIENLSKAFGGLKAVNNFSLTLEEGEIVGLIGPNGAGKTTVFNLITGLYKPTSGTIRFLGEEISGLPPFKISQRGIARTFQNIRLFKGNTVLDNVRAVFHPRIKYNFFDALLRTPRFTAEELRVTQKAMELLEALNLDKRANEKAANLAYGDQRRLEIARALATQPRLLLLDEPAAGMNPAEVRHMVQLIRFIKEKYKLTILLIEHQMGMVMNLCERLVVMDFGQIIAKGTPLEIRNNPVVLEAYLGKGATVA
ncbi:MULTISPECIES: ABC transporter ATP-binding protein [Desulfofundulus]|uniref:Amino acid/amide ABC transporter ATP-binding protein 1, HAAT family n=1 Tax=Desulfofundulus australicus DSM 11792 TaxID=1121425 RepID=A0A1M5C5P1_9FIRM|nr:MULTISPECIES: ABC transporter ATP-binding protein [Desulfofundulus]MCS5695846.1 ABC transporter ATP-binding protein [Desulfofundulus thermocisternus]SHF49927.1 amino acid/amide ABC transporter ATP-binding protein 1, HAAT family [Desulfofundulus australicus DSM 11792]